MGTYAIVDGGSVVNLVSWDGLADFAAPAGTSLVDTGGAHVSIGFTYAGGAFADPDPPPAVVVPATITKRQMLLWLLANKSKTEADVLSAIDTIADPTAKAEAEIAFKYPDGNIMHRSSPLFDQLGSLFSMTAADIDAAFTAAAAL